MPRPPEARRAGFTLVEVLVALAVLAMALGAVLPLIAAGLRAATAADDSVAAVLAAKSLLAAAGVEAPLAVGEESGALDGSRWRRSVRPAEALPATWGLGLFEVRVTVERGAAEVTLTTLRAVPQAAEGG